ncbi:Cys-rich peptide radical SAM maturase CcpM [Clostridium sp. CMCC3677]|uniref:Cys-rich peptide radical SAM maturase CcpM n=1 Tax=Clostridium sp. CMCC3677 TaxID=2949963 RepID=UPI0013F0F82F|nr:Cys-rich peptide radical SAM maturase CcpM [Clostridium sp. CMCC3677]NFG63092.1 Cys-rich peptide radical SAM maturase CcpM [Clostridium botulinum]NFQ08022.1 Cys-rich peptide radical SAM maturase CcpM [Clostridium botulinum]
MNDKPLIKLFKTNDRYYIYDTNKNTILNISNKQYNSLENYMKDDVDYCINSEEINKFCKEYSLSSNRVKYIDNPHNEIVPSHLESNVGMIILQVTQQCNFRCEYCVYSGSYLTRTHSNKRMGISTAFKGIDFLISHSKNVNKIDIAFYGGEPLLEFDFIKKCIDYAEKKAEGKKVTFYITTNGSILTDQIVEFLYKHDVMLTISLDGPKEIHDDHRKLALNNSGTFDKVIKNIINIKNKFPKYIDNIIFNVVIDTENDFYCIDKFFLDYEAIKDIAIISGTISNNNRKSSIEINEDYYLKAGYELFRIFYYLIRKKNTNNCSRIIIEQYSQISKLSESLMPQKMLPEKAHPSGSCIPGTQRLFMNVDGFFYPCERVSETSEIMEIGHIDTGFDINKVMNLFNFGKINKEACKNCWAIRHCSMCAGLLEADENEFSQEKREECCKSIKASVEENFKDYCFLKEFGHNFDKNEEMNVFND